MCELPGASIDLGRQRYFGWLGPERPARHPLVDMCLDEPFERAKRVVPFGGPVEDTVADQLGRAPIWTEDDGRDADAIRTVVR